MRVLGNMEGWVGAVKGAGAVAVAVMSIVGMLTYGASFVAWAEDLKDTNLEQVKVDLKITAFIKESESLELSRVKERIQFYRDARKPVPDFLLQQEVVREGRVADYEAQLKELKARAVELKK